ncbi:hypothetical protein AXG93_1089s1080 [Marchantia polymorpha subsp. ruderalis]|uniref:Uncharacterized protein n=1 Tax=Marchantia polymorpha subsp. ruderalis TaxID=1480154 RepID=A0A176WHZ2_MARPO|nr:hypothetical protein AXG93_1089s1080 [Marchantia polymorpha subsp. ruderalis]
MNTPLERIAKVLVVSSDIEKDLVFMEIVIEKAIENAGGEAYGPQKVGSPRTSTGRVILETGEDPSTQEAQLQDADKGDNDFCGYSEGTAEHAPEAKYEVLRKRQDEEVEKRRYSKKACEGLREDVEKAKCVTVDLLSRLEASWTAYNVETLRVDELTATLKKKDQEYAAELAAKAKKLAECEDSRILDLELFKKLETCNNPPKAKTAVWW